MAQSTPTHRPSKLAPPPVLPSFERQPSSASVHSSSSSDSSHSSHSSVIARKRQQAFGSSAQEEQAHSIRRPACSILAILGLVTICHFVGLYFFTSGFLLKRDEIVGVASCNRTTPQSVQPPGSLQDSDLWRWDAEREEHGECALPPAFDTAVILFIDALRFDFIAPIDTEANQGEDNWTPSPFHHSHFTTPAKLDATSRGRGASASFLAHFLSDAPTATLQRLKGLTTGTLPTFIDAGSNFGGEAVGEDNWIRQFRAMSHTQRYGQGANFTGLPAGLGFMGDDTWMKVYPDLFDADWTHPFDSFNVEDLHTADNGVREKLLPFLDGSHEDLKGWKLLIAHTLGVDHVGHRHTPSHSLMAVKLRQMDTFLNEILADLPEDTLFVLAGDHGMDVEGDHGGEGELEVGSGLWMYTKRASGFAASLSSSIEEQQFHLDVTALKQASDISEETGPPASRFFSPLGNAVKHRSIPQVDFVPSMSFLLGTPPPFGNLGSVVPELFPPVAAASEDTEPSRLLRALRINARQIRRFLPSSGSDLQVFSSELENAYLQALKADALAQTLIPKGWKISSKDRDDYYEARREAMVKYQLYNRLALYRARSVWAVFNYSKIAAGLLLLIGSVAMIVKLINLTRMEGVKTFPLARSVGKVFAMGGGGGAAFGFLVYIIGNAVGSTSTLGIIVSNLSPVESIAAAALLGGELSVILSPFQCLMVDEDDLLLTAEEVKQAYQSSSAKKSGTKKRRTRSALGSSWTKDIIALSPVLAHAAIFASNSLTVWEDSVVHALLVAVLAYRAWDGWSEGTWLLEQTLKGSGIALAAKTNAKAIATRSRQRIPYFLGGSILLIRLLKVIQVCREEQAPSCTVSNFQLPALSTLLDPSTPIWHWIPPVAILACTYALSSYILPVILCKSLAQSKSDTGLVHFWSDWIFRTSLMLGSGWWIVDWIGEGLVTMTAASEQIPTSQVGKAAIIQWGKNLIARADFALVLIIGPVIWFFAPLCLEVKDDDHVAASATNGTTTDQGAQQQPAQRKVHLLGFSNVFGSKYLLFVSLIFSLSWIMSPPVGQLTIAAAFLILILLAEVGDAERDLVALGRLLSPSSSVKGKRSSVSSSNGDVNSGSSRVPRMLEISTLHLFSHYLLFKTGHQATFLSIQWRTAFIGLSKLTYPWSPLLVSLNSFGPMSLLGGGLIVPLFISWNLPPVPRNSPSPPPPTTTTSTESSSSPSAQSPSSSSSAQAQAQATSSTHHHQQQQQKMRTPLHLLQTQLKYLLITTLLTLIVALFSTHFRRHLMLFKIWAPRLMLSMVSLVGADLTALLGFATWAVVAGKVGVTLGSAFE